MKKHLVLAIASLHALGAFAQAPSFGTFEKPFAANSPWYIRPINPVFGGPPPPLSPIQDGSTVPWYGTVAPGIYSTAAFKATSADPSMVVYPHDPSKGIWDPDAREALPSITIPHWPAGTVLPATGADGHADIIDIDAGIIHSFWQLKLVNGQWRSTQHAWSRLDGKGWPDPSHIYQGARAVGVPTIGGVIRKHEVNDGEALYKHVLAMSMSREALQGKPITYVYPAASADSGSTYSHTGTFPEGALVMLPPDFQLEFANPLLQKVVNTLKVYGARVVDENTATPFYIYVENGAAFPLYTGNDANVYKEMENIRKKLQQVSADSYVDGNGAPTTSNVPGNDNILSLRGAWATDNLPVTGLFNSMRQRIDLPAQVQPKTYVNGNGTGIAGGSIANGGVTWAQPVPGASYKVTAIATGGARLKIDIYKGSSLFGGTGWLSNGQSAVVTWPVGGWTGISVIGAANQAGSITGTMIKQ